MESEWAICKDDLSRPLSNLGLTSDSIKISICSGTKDMEILRLILGGFAIYNL